jgi:hypothetical protein
MSNGELVLRLHRAPKTAVQGDFESWLRENKQHAKPQQRREAELAFQKIISMHEPATVGDLLGYYHSRVIKWVEEYLTWLRATPYFVNIINNTSSTFSDVAWAYKTRDGSVFINARHDVTSGNAVLFSYAPCIDMMSYSFSIYIAGVKLVRSPDMTVEEVNHLERQAYGQIAMCEDTWDVLEGA